MSSVTPKPINSYRKFWAHRFGIAPFLPTTQADMEARGWDSCDVIIVTGDAYIDHPSFGMALVGRLLEAQGFREFVHTSRKRKRRNFREALPKAKLFRRQAKTLPPLVF